MRDAPRRSNASKIAQSRAEAAKRDSVKAGGGGSVGMAERAGANLLTLKCAICKVGFFPGGSDAQIKAHADSKHAKLSYQECFPTHTFS